jgi:hypothetical protein
LIAVDLAALVANETSEGDTVRRTRIFKGMGGFFLVVGVLKPAGEQIALIVVTVTGEDAQGLAVVAMGRGSGVAWPLIGAHRVRFAVTLPTASEAAPPDRGRLDPLASP